MEIHREILDKILDQAQEIIEAQPMLLRLHSPLIIGTDIHG